MQYCVYTRSYYEQPYLDFFIEHYIKLGFNKIVILQSDDIEYNPPEQFSHIVEIHNIKNLGNGSLPKYDYIVKNRFDWILCVDIDEILLLDQSYQNINHYVETMLDTYPNLTTFYFRWGMIEKYDIISSFRFCDILKNYNIYSNVHIKTMVRSSHLKSIHHPHMCTVRDIQIYFEGSILTENNPCHPVSDISYQDHVLVHLHTRSIHNLIIKSMSTCLVNKNIVSKEGIKKLVNDYRESDLNENILNTFKQTIGQKSILPFIHAKSEKCHLNASIFPVFEYKYLIINQKLEEKLLDIFLKKYNINKIQYNNFTKRLQNITRPMFT